MSARIGILVFATKTGLGYQTREYARFLKPTKLLAVNLSPLNKVEVHPEWYKEYDTQWVYGFPTFEDIDKFLDGLDAVFVCETPLTYYLFEEAKRRGIITIQQYNWEFIDYLEKPYLQLPTVLAAPSNWHITDAAQIPGFAEVINWPVPINREELPFREIKECKTFIHIIGRPAVHDRNGTIQFLQAAKKIGKQFAYKIFLQIPHDPRAQEYFAPVAKEIEAAKESINLEVITDTPNQIDLYNSGDVLVMPRKYGGLCLPMQEALSVGLPVIATNISPNIDLLPSHWLVEATFERTFYAHVDIDIFQANVDRLAEKMLEFKSNLVMQMGNQIANDLAEQMSWKKLGPIQLKMIQDLVAKNAIS